MAVGLALSNVGLGQISSVTTPKYLTHIKFGNLSVQFAVIGSLANAAVVIGAAALTGGVGSIVGKAAGVLLMVTIRNGLDLLGVNPF